MLRVYMVCVCLCVNDPAARGLRSAPRDGRQNRNRQRKREDGVERVRMSSRTATIDGSSTYLP